MAASMPILPFCMIHREELNAEAAKRVGGEPADEADHFMICPTCGQALDMREAR